MDARAFRRNRLPRTIRRRDTLFFPYKGGTFSRLLDRRAYDNDTLLPRSAVVRTRRHPFQTIARARFNRSSSTATGERRTRGGHWSPDEFGKYRFFVPETRPDAVKIRTGTRGGKTELINKRNRFCLFAGRNRRIDDTTDGAGVWYLSAGTAIAEKPVVFAFSEPFKRRGRATIITVTAV